MDILYLIEPLTVNWEICLLFSRNKYENHFMFTRSNQKYLKIVIIDRKASSLTSEKDDGYIEYKWKLLDSSKERLNRLSSQMNYRLNEGAGKSVYAIGFLDNGKAIGISKCDMKITLQNIVYASTSISATINKILIFINNNTYWAKIFIER